MTETEREKIKIWVDNWKETGKILEKLRREEIRKSNLAESLAVFDDALRSALWLEPAKPYSGLVKFHEILARTR